MTDASAGGKTNKQHNITNPSHPTIEIASIYPPIRDLALYFSSIIHLLEKYSRALSKSKKKILMHTDTKRFYSFLPY